MKNFHFSRSAQNRGVLTPLVFITLAAISAMGAATLHVAALQSRVHRMDAAEAQAVADERSAILWAQAVGKFGDDKVQLEFERSSSDRSAAMVTVDVVTEDRLEIVTKLASETGPRSVLLKTMIVHESKSAENDSADEQDFN